MESSFAQSLRLRNSFYDVCLKYLQHTIVVTQLELWIGLQRLILPLLASYISIDTFHKVIMNI